MESAQTFYTTQVHVYVSENLIKMENSLLVKFDEIWPKSLYYKYRDFSPILEQLKKFIKNPILIGISSNFLHNIRTCICITKIIKIEISLLVKFDEIWRKTMYYSTWCLAQLLSNFKIHKKSNFHRNQLKLSTQHKYMYMYQKKL